MDWRVGNGKFRSYPVPIVKLVLSKIASFAGHKTLTFVVPKVVRITIAFELTDAAARMAPLATSPTAVNLTEVGRFLEGLATD